jgi:glycosyltransferase involved in cell wall biosynthesis
MTGNRLAVVVPVYNEEQNLGNFTKDWMELFAALGIDYSIHFYNDKSSDQSMAVLNDLCSKHVQLTVTDFAINGGHGPAILTGYHEHLTADWIFQVDSDHQLSCAVFEQLWMERANADMLLGERHRFHHIIFRKTLTAVSSLFVKYFFGTQIRDVNCPYRLIRASLLLKEIALIPRYCFAPNVLISAIAVNRKWRIKTFPVEKINHRYTHPPSFSIRMFKGAVQTLIDLTKLRARL